MHKLVNPSYLHAFINLCQVQTGISSSMHTPASPQAHHLKSTSSSSSKTSSTSSTPIWPHITSIQIQYDGRLYQTRLANDIHPDRSTGTLRLTPLENAEDTPLSVVTQQESSWMNRIREQLTRAKTSWNGHTDKTDNTDGVDTDNEDENEDAQHSVPRLMTRLWVKGIPKDHSSTKQTTPTGTIAVDVTEAVKITFGQPPKPNNSSASSSTSSSALRCVHLTYQRQTLLDAMHAVPPSAKVANIRALDTYQKTRKEPE